MVEEEGRRGAGALYAGAIIIVASQAALALIGPYSAVQGALLVIVAAELASLLLAMYEQARGIGILLFGLLAVAYALLASTYAVWYAYEYFAHSYTLSVPKGHY